MSTRNVLFKPLFKMLQPFRRLMFFELATFLKLE